MSNPRAEIVGTPTRYDLDGVRDDLLTAGLGADGLRGPPPAFADPVRPTARELRRRAIYMNYRGLLDVTADGGFGTLFGASGGSAVPGIEYLFAMRTPDGNATTSGLLQIPRGFDPENPCLLVVASSGSRGIYGALPTAGEWGLRHGYAVVHSDKGTGTGIFEADRGRGVRIDGVVTDADDPLVTFAASASAVARLTSSRPHSVLFKHANSGLNVEAHWGEYLLQAIDAACRLLNREYPRRARALTPENTLVVAAGISNGGGAVLRALEHDSAGWIRGAVVAEPNVDVSGRTAGLAIESGGQACERIGLSLFDYGTEHLLLQPCALLAEAERSLPVRNAISDSRSALEQWCRELGEMGVLPRTDIATQAQEARRTLLQAGILPEALQLGHMNVLASLWSAIAVSYAAAYGKLAADEFPCGVSFAAVAADGSPRPLSEEEFARAFSDSSGIAPTAGLNLVGPDSAGRVRAIGLGSAALAVRLRSLHTGSSLTERIAAGEREVLMTGHLPGRPVIIVQGRADALIPANHSARAYYLVAQRHEDTRSQLRYYEIEHAQHFDAFLALPELAARYVPMQPQLLEAMDLMSAHLRSDTPLPPSQVVRSRPRAMAGEKVAPLSRDNLGAVRDKPAADAITFDGTTLHVPQ